MTDQEMNAAIDALADAVDCLRQRIELNFPLSPEARTAIDRIARTEAEIGIENIKRIRDRH